MPAEAEGDPIQGWLNDQALVNRRDSRFPSGRIGLWTKADSITTFDELTVIQLNALDGFNKKAWYEIDRISDRELGSHTRFGLLGR